MVEGGIRGDLSLDGPYHGKHPWLALGSAVGCVWKRWWNIEYNLSIIYTIESERKKISIALVYSSSPMDMYNAHTKRGRREAWIRPSQYWCGNDGSRSEVKIKQ